MILIVSEIMGQVYSRPSIGIWCFSPDETGVHMGLVEEDHRDKVSFSSYCMKGTYFQMIYGWWHWLWSPGWDSVISIPREYPITAAPFPYTAEESPYTQPTLFKKWGVTLHILEGRVATTIIWNSTAWKFVPFPSFINLHSHLFIFIHEYLFYLGVIIQYYFYFLV